MFFSVSVMHTGALYVRRVTGTAVMNASNFTNAPLHVLMT